MVKNMADKELLSALMDGDTVDNALITKLEQDLESQEIWQNYHLISDVMRGEGPKTANWNIAESVSAALEAESAHIKEPEVNTAPVPLIESQPTPRQAKRHLPAWLGQLGQVGIAACVSMAVIFGVQQYGSNGNEVKPTDPFPVLQTVPLAGSVEPVSLTRDSVPATSNTLSESQKEQQRRRITSMLQDYELQLRLTAENAVESDLETLPVVE